MNFLTDLKNLHKLLAGKNIRSLIILLFLLIFSNLVEFLSLATIPAYISFLINGDIKFLNFLDLNTSFNFTFNYLNSTIIILLIFIVKFIVLLFINFYEINVLKNIKVDLSSRLLESYLYRNYSFFLKNGIPFLSNILINELSNAVGLIQSLLTIFKEVFLFLVIFILVFIYEPLLSFYVVLSFILIGLIFYFLTVVKLKKNSVQRSKFSAEVFKSINQSLKFIKEIKVFNKEIFFYKMFVLNKNIYEQKMLIQDFIMRLPKLIFELFGIILIFIILVISLKSGEGNLLQAAPFVALLSACILKMMPAFKSISGSITHLIAFYNSFQLISNEIINNKYNLKTDTNLKNLKLKKTTNDKNFLEINNLYYNYDNTKSILNDLNIEIKKNSITGIMGKSGSGKTTLINIILGLLKQQSGEIKLNNEYFSDLAVSYVPQDILILDDNIRNNIAFGIDKKYISDEKIKNTIKLAGLETFFQKNNYDLNLNLGENGIRISGGERQRIGIARALYFDPELIIFDESTSALDVETENEILLNIKQLSKLATIIMIAHKTSTLNICDLIYYIDKGHIKDLNTLYNLIKKYPEINYLNQDIK